MPESIRPAPPRAERPEEEEIPPELLPYVPEAEAFLKNYSHLFATIAGDRSLKYIFGTGFYIDLVKGVICLDLEDFKNMKERGESEWMIVWSVCHELSHFHDLKENPQEMLAIYEYYEKRAAELVPRAIETLKKRFGEKIPEIFTREYPFGSSGERKKTGLEILLYQKLASDLYNPLDDMYVNMTLALRSPVFFDPDGSAALEIRRLYRDYLFPTNTDKIGEPPKPSEAVDYAKKPRSMQLVDSLLRRRMVPDQEVLISEETREALNSYADVFAQQRKITLAREIETTTQPGNTKAKDPGWRYKQIQRAVEPKFLELFFKDLEDMEIPPPKPPGKGKGKGKGKGQGQGLPQPGEPQPDEPQPGKPEKPQPGAGGDPWESKDDHPEHIDLDMIKKFIKEQKDKEKADKAKKNKEEKAERLSPTERGKALQQKIDQQKCEKFGVDPELAQKYRELESSVEPYAKELGQVFERLMQSIEQRLSYMWAEGFRTGKFNVDRFIRKYGGEVAIESPEAIPWEALDVYDQREFMTRLMLFPNRLRVRLVFDGSGSMNEERILAVKQLFVLITQGLSNFEAAVNRRFKLKEPIRVDTEVMMFGSPGQSRTVKEFQGKVDDDREMADRFRALGKITGEYGGTCDAEPFWAIAKSIDAHWEQELKDGRAKEIIFEVTDGGQNEISANWQGGTFPQTVNYKGQEVGVKGEAMQDTRNAVDAVEKKGAVVRALQIGTEEALRLDERAQFDTVWGEHGARVAHPAEVAPAVAHMLEDEIKKIKMKIQYQGVEEAEDDEEI